MGAGHAANTPTRTFVYDSTGFACPAGGTVVGNVAGRLAEAYTGSSSSKITDVGLCYTARGEISDVFTSTAHSGGYFHTASSYLANGTVNALAGYLASGATFVPTIFYTTDGEGRWYSATATSGPNPLTNVFYNPSGTISALTFGSNDTDSFLYDSADRMKKYTFTLNGTSEIGTPTWNANGSLASLAVTDPFNSANVQTCTYSYDDLSRITSANCGSVWAQTFGYDPFGNLTKNGSVSWQPGYDQTTNRYTLSGTGYDSNGNLTNDSFRAYTWDSNGRPVAIGNKTITYDALGRMAEKLDGGVYSQFVYTPVGSLMARMTGQAGSSVRIPLAGSWAVYGATQTFNHYEHLDWLGNSRLSSGQSRTMISDMSYAPFGEVYGSTSGTGVNFTGMRSDVVTQSGGVTNGLYDFPARELPPTQGRWLSPDPSGIASANPLHPQTWNRYAYVGNNPLGKIDPSGLFCAYLNDAGTGLDKKGVDDNSNFAECAENGGYWIEGSYGGGSWVTANADLGLVAGLGYNSQGNSEVSVAGAVDSNGVGSNPFGAFTLTVSGTFNLPVNELMWAAQQTTPVSGPWHYGNWAGPGGMGSPINKTDAAALTHDYCYAQGGFTPGSNFQQANPQLQACNQQLCDAVRARSAELSYMTWQAGPAAEFQADGDINQYFTYIVRSGNACH